MRLFLIILFYGIFLTSLSQSVNKEETIIEKTQTREFSIECGSTKGDEKENPILAVKLNLTCKYNSKENNISIILNGIKDTVRNFELDYPLNFEVFTEKLNQKFIEYDSTNKDKYIKYRSHLEVFYWIVRLKENHNKPTAGMLSLAKIVKVSTNNNQTTHSTRVKKVALTISQINRFKSKYNQLTVTLDTINALITKNDTSAINNWKKQNNNTEVIKYRDSINNLLTNTKSNYQNKIKSFQDQGMHKVTNVKIQFERGFIERIQVYLNYPQINRQEIFENIFPIGFTSISNYRKMSGVKLFKRTNTYEKSKDVEFILLSDIIELYDNHLNLLTKDYSPGDTTISLSPNSEPIIVLNKENSVHIIDAKTFTDLNGFNEDSPNGLVQIELSRHFNLLTHRHQSKNRNNFGFINYLNTQVNFLKLENKLKGLPLRNEFIIENSQIISPNYATNLDFKRYESLGINIQSNVFLFDTPDYKSTFYFDIATHYGYTPVIDSNYRITNGEIIVGETKRLDAHNFTLSPKVILQLFAEKRYGLKLSYTYNKTWLFTNNRFKQVLSYSGKGNDLTSFSTNRNAKIFHTVEATMFFNSDPKSHSGKVFGVARFHFQHRDINTFFPQILIGYAFNFFK